jgi:hypothetical protein
MSYRLQLIEYDPERRARNSRCGQSESARARKEKQTHPEYVPTWFISCHGRWPDYPLWKRLEIFRGKRLAEK